jgi:exodeoxyribonuclease VII small subunit
MTTQPTDGQPTDGQPTDGQPTYEQAREELVEVVRRLESGGTDLEESLALWERGEQLARICEGWLEGARSRLDAAIAADDET